MDYVAESSDESGNIKFSIPCWMSTIVFELSRKKSHFPEQFWEDKYCVLGKQNIKRNIEGKEYACKLKYLNFFTI